ncbi:MAG: ORF6N domain-containing protein [Clostridium cadaveris]|uniref:ORF6N domain-containing protein n=1 Tax=Clostridium cadaveris TaxID=1529 RepID=UPI002A8987EC|nr:ORF6N domain-containing protein [Clostridium cadaveris]
MKELIPLEFKNQRIMTTKVLSEQFGTEDKIIHQNFKRNEDRFIEGKHYYKLEGEELKEFKANLHLEGNLKFIPVLYLWTERGAARHAKILDTDEAWEVYEKLEETYFRVQEQSKPTCIEDLIIMQAQSLKDMREQVNQANYHALEAKAEAEKSREEIQAMRDAITLDSNGWRKETTAIINKIATKLGGFSEVNLLKREIYKLLDTRLGVDVNRRLLEKKKRMALEGVCKSKIDKVNVLDVIAEDKKLIDGYVNIIRQYALKHNVA